MERTHGIHRREIEYYRERNLSDIFRTVNTSEKGPTRSSSFYVKGVVVSIFINSRCFIRFVHETDLDLIVGLHPVDIESGRSTGNFGL